MKLVMSKYLLIVIGYKKCVYSNSPIKVIVVTSNDSVAFDISSRRV